MARIETVTQLGERLAKRLDDQDEGKPLKGRRATDRRAYARFHKAVALSFWPPVLGKGNEAVRQFEILVTQQAGSTPRPGIVTAFQSFHGRTYAAMTAK